MVKALVKISVVFLVTSCGHPERNLSNLNLIVGSDDRVEVTTNRQLPFSAVGQINFKTQSGGSGTCTGTLVGPRHVITAGHCVHKDGEWYSEVTFTPGKRGSDEPYGRINSAKTLSVTAWIKNADHNYDYGMVVLDQDIGQTTSWLTPGSAASMDLSYNMTLIGFPGDKVQGSMWKSNCRPSQLTDQLIMHPCDTTEGMSGAALYVYFKESGQRIVYGIHSGGEGGVNRATRFDDTKYQRIVKWIQEN